MINVLSAMKAGGSYWKVEVQDLKTNAVYSHFMYETEYKLLRYEQNVIGKTVTREILDELKDLHNDVSHHERCMEENEE